MVFNNINMNIMILVAGTVSVLEIERSGLQRPTRIPLEFTCHSTRAGTLSILITSVFFSEMGHLLILKMERAIEDGERKDHMK